MRQIYDDDYVEKKLQRAVNDIKALKLKLKNGDVKLPDGGNFEGLKIGGRIATSTLVIREYPTCLTSLEVAAKWGKLKKVIDERLKKIVVETHHLNIELPKLKPPLNNDEEDNLGTLLELEEEQRLSERSAMIKHDKANMFKFRTNQPFPSFFSYVPDKNFLIGCKAVLHPSFAQLFEDYHRTDSDEVKVTPNQGFIEVYDDPKMNEALMFMVNHYCKRFYHVKPFKMPDVLEKLILFGSPDMEVDDENIPESTGVEVDSIYTCPEFSKHFKTHKLNKALNVDEKSLTEYVVQHFTQLSNYNFHKKGNKQTIQYDKNYKAMLEVLRDYCRENRFELEHLLKYYSTISLDETIKTYILMFSRYYEEYHTKKIPDDLFTKKPNKSGKEDAPKNKK
ncbi:hypothetical protein THF1C08_100089 [Vibrio jasicida]|uniref:Uncharacterized protein n=1 Tax=Vibrio jasicida TaxID=766224 RepID=A0AAU9QXY8_9VIBR|nr:hypothetical protein THF1C08_100089 [Vibrio jasicida]CAH1603984.1 hypothetical protein THF1A12_90088 [Vibrio jasicida]